MTQNEKVRLAKLEVQSKTMKEDLREVRLDVKSILATLAEARGGWRTLMLVAGAGGTLGALFVKIATLLQAWR